MSKFLHDSDNDNKNVKAIAIPLVFSENSPAKKEEIVPVSPILWRNGESLFWLTESYPHYNLAFNISNVKSLSFFVSTERYIITEHNTMKA